MTEREKVLLIVNPAAGQLHAKTGLMDILCRMNKLGAEVTVYTTGARGDARRMAAEGASRYDRIICCGGDGTLNETVNGIMEAAEAGLEKPVKLGYIPAGSTNDFAAGLGLPKNLGKAAAAAMTGTERLLDVGSFNKRKFVYVASFGLFSATSYQVDQSLKNVIGHMAYVFAGMQELGNIREYSAKIIADGKDYSGDYIYGSISNATSIGGILKMDPKNVDLSDGKFEVMLIHPLDTADELARVASSVISQKPDPTVMEFFHASEIEIEFEDKVSWSLDGEEEKGGRKAHIRNLCKELHFYS